MNYAAAVNDPNEAYFNDERPEGIIAHPMNCAAITWPVSERILEYIEAADFPKELIATQVHFTELLEFHRFVRPGVEDHIAKLAGVDVVEVIGMKHEIFDDGIFAFVRPKKGATLSAQAVMDHCKEIASYKRPQHVEIWPADKEFPLTRSTKVDKIALQRLAGPIIESLRKAGGWDAGQVA